ncbi:MAG: DUF58 domain-containing protein, partial [Bdellovibrionales bacterium]|nr:DUF58 domain-containing protein [Bdellovibrionales bacterium]
LRLINQSRSSRQMITLSSEASKLGHGDSVLVEEIKSQTSLLRSLVFSPMKRGIHSIPLMTVSTIFPLGLFRAWMRVDPNGRVIVYPNPSGHLPLNLRAKDDEGGDLRDQAGGIQHGDEFRDYRRYSYGDSYHRVDWKVFARRRKLMIKEFEGEARRRISIRFEDAPLGDLEVILSQLSRWLELAKEKGSPYELVLPNKKITFGSGHQHYQKCQRELAHFGILS